MIFKKKERVIPKLSDEEKAFLLAWAELSKPEELVHDFEAIIAILEKALKEIRGEE